MKTVGHLAVFAFSLAVIGCSSPVVRTAPWTRLQFSKLLAPDFKIATRSKKEESELPEIYALFASQRYPDELLLSLEFESPSKAYATILESHWMHGNSSLTFIKENGGWKIVDWWFPV
jgi:hypothetical protein